MTETNKKMKKEPEFVKGPYMAPVEEGAKVYLGDDPDFMYDEATRQCDVLRPVLQNPQCDDKTRETVIGIIKDILRKYDDTNEINKRKEQIFFENPEFFPKDLRHLLPHQYRTFLKLYF